MAKEPNINISKIPNYVTHVTSTLQNAGFEAFLVGGCVRDLIMEREPKDWDITTNAKPEEIINLFEKTVYENNFGTVGVCFPIQINTPAQADILIDLNKSDVSGETIRDLDLSSTENKENVTHVTKYNIVEVTPYRTEAKYSDFRHPDEVKFSDKLEDDLKRRDFTMNSIALSIKGQDIEIKDIFNGLKDIKDKTIKAVGIPNDRFQEDALRMLRAIRFSTELDFVISAETMIAIVDNSDLIKNISFERIRDEFTKIIMSKNPSVGIVMLQKLGLLKYIIPELEEGIGCEQTGEHIYDVYDHLLHALDHASGKNWGLEIRLSALFHDIGKPRSRRNINIVKANQGTIRNKKQFTFYGHEVVGERIVKKIMERLKYPRNVSEKVISFTRNHMFFSDTEKISLSAVRRIVQNVGKENIWDLMKVRECDRVGMKKPEAPYRLRKYHAMIEEVLHDPISVSQLKIDGNYLINKLHMKPSRRMGWILNAILEEVLDDPNKNTEKHLEELAKSLDMLNDEELKVLGERGKNKKDQLEQEEIKKLHKKHGV